MFEYQHGLCCESFCKALYSLLNRVFLYCATVKDLSISSTSAVCLELSDISCRQLVAIIYIYNGIHTLYFIHVIAFVMQ